MLNLKEVIIGYNNNYFFNNLTNYWNIGNKRTIKHNLTLKDIHKQIRSMRFDPLYNAVGGKNNNNVDFEKAKLIPFVIVYYYLFTKLHRIPSPQEMICEYLLQFCDINNDNLYHIKLEYAEFGYNTTLSFDFLTLAGRMCRAYNSFNREVELAFYLMQFPELQMRYNFQIDYYEGIDLQVRKKNEVYNIACYQQSRGAVHYKHLKEKYRHEEANKNILNMAISKNNYTLCGDVWLFSKKEKEKLVKIILNK